MSGPASPGAFGTAAAGFRLTNTALELRIEAWGYWPADVIAAFRKNAVPAASRLAAHAAFVLDANQSKPQGADGQEALRELFRALSGAAFASASVIAENALTRMQLARLVREGGLDGRVDFA